MLEHGGTDLGPAVAWDFSTNANPSPQPERLSMALAGADRRRYPEPSYLHLRECLAQAGLGDAQRILPTAGSAEAIRRLTLKACLAGVTRVWTPWPGFGEYAAAAEALGLTVQPYRGINGLAEGVRACRALGEHAPMLVWVCDPCNPTGRSLSESVWRQLADLCADHDLTLAVDLAYQPLRWPQPPHAAPGQGALPACVSDIAWQLWSPNKALGLTGVRAGALVAPATAERPDIDRLLTLAPSWVLSAEGVALLQAWCEPDVRAWLVNCAQQLATWRDELAVELHALGWSLYTDAPTSRSVDRQPNPHDDQLVHESGQGPVVPFLLAKPPEGESAAHVLQRCRAAGIRLRDATSLGLPGWLRLRAHVPEARHALLACLRTRQQAVRT